MAETPSSNSSYHIKPFDTKIDCFNSQNRRQLQLSHFMLEVEDPLSPPTKK
jgi:hypothetical protein